MSDNACESILAKIEESKSLYNRLVIIVGPPGSGKTRVMNKVAEKLGAPRINVNLTLSEKLLDIPTKRRPLSVSKILGQIISDSGGNTVLLDNTEMLFHPNLMTDPLQLFRQLSRNRTIVVSWNGAINQGDLVYANPGHPEYKKYAGSDITIVELNPKE
jgi:Cdc6-like AAA superfamily ATPase